MSQRTRTIMLLLPVAVLLLLAAFPDVAAACPNCKEAYMDAGGGSSPVASGFNTSIVFMMIMPFVVMGLFVLRLWTAMRKQKAQDAVA